MFRRLRRVCLALPEATETASWGHPNFRAGKRTFCAFELFGGRPSIALRVSAAEAKQLGRRRHFFLTPYGRGVWVSRWLDVDANPGSLAALIDRSYRQVAPRNLVRLLDSQAATASGRTRTPLRTTRRLR
ncbi:MAG TPA: MmcQ/YjbR family DNA-binding protein [Vicinamibacterales bacterium]